MSIAERIQYRRLQLGLTREALAELAGTDQKQLWRYEKGKTIPSAEVIANFADALNVTADYILGLTDEIRPILGDSDLDADEIELLNLYRAKPDKQDTILTIVRAV